MAQALDDVIPTQYGILGAIENVKLTPLLCAFDGLILPSLRCCGLNRAFRRSKPCWLPNSLRGGSSLGFRG